MRLPRLSRPATWLSLAAVFLMDVSPVRGLVLCVEPDGSAALESSLPGAACGECVQDAGESDAEVSDAANAAGLCPCVDIPVPSSEGLSKRIARAAQIDARPAPQPVVPSAVPSPREPAGVVAPRVLASEPLQRLELIRSVVLLV